MLGRLNTKDRSSILTFVYGTKWKLRTLLPLHRFAKRPALGIKISLIVPCYNVGEYIDDFFLSVATQSVGVTNLEIIAVDDGSTDDTANRIRNWQAKIPGVITYVHQQNAGLSNARNTGLLHATGEWISFPDPDDFCDIHYLHEVRREIERRGGQRLAMLACNLIKYGELKRAYLDEHALNYRFKDKLTTRKVAEMDDFIHLHAASTFYLRQKIEQIGLRFDPDIKPGFEDALFTNLYLLHAAESNVSFLRDAVYFYRKRANETSLQDKARTRKEFYLSQPRGWLKLLESAKSLHGRVPVFIQNTIIYDTLGRLRLGLNAPQMADFLTPDELNEYLDLLFQTYASIDADVIANYTVTTLHEDLKSLINLYLKPNKPKSTTVVLRTYDKAKDLLQFEYFSRTSEDNAVVSVDGIPILQKHYPKTIARRFFGRLAFHEIKFWLPLKQGRLLAKVDGNGVVFRFPRGIRINREFDTSDLPKLLKKERILSIRPKAIAVRLAKKLGLGTAKYHNAWIMMDRPDKADDNAEHFYRYLMQNHPEINAWFALKPESPDWPRLKAEGFKLLEVSSYQHVLAVVNASVLASSHGDAFVRKPHPRSRLSDLQNFKFVFLQHGITLHDQSSWFNGMGLAKLIAGATPEYRDFVDPDSTYLFTKKEVALTGFPRHDGLLAKPATSDIILLFPTWRQSLVERSAKKDGQRTLKKGFEKTEYVIAWRELLNSPGLKAVSERYGKQLVFCIHPNFANELAAFKVPAHVRAVNPLTDTSLQPLLRQATVMVSDYSSILFDAAYLQKPIVYYQFDQQTFYAGHIYRPGYFDYRDHGFGPVVTDVTGVVDTIDQSLRGEELPVYAKRREAFFPYRDGKCSERVFNAILELDEPLDTAAQQSTFQKTI